MNALVEQTSSYNDVKLLRLAREVAMDIVPLTQILEQHQIDQNEWEGIAKHPHFQSLLASERQAWESATNSEERVRFKSLAMIEEALPEFYARMHDAREPLTAKTEVLKTIARFAGVGNNSFDSSVSGEKLSVTINLGADHQLKIEKELPAKVIEGEAA